MKSTARLVSDTHQKNFVKLFDSCCGAHSRWEIWSDFITLTAISINIIVDRVHAEERAKTYKTIASKYTEKEIAVFGQMLDEIVSGLDDNPDQDFLGEMYMSLELGNDHAGQFFTPYCVCKAMSMITVPDTKQMVEAKGWFGCSDPACGAGALLVAFANVCKEQGVNYQTSVLFVAQDIDYIVSMMCYIQLSLLGCAGYVVIGDSLAHPSVSVDRRGLIPVDKGNVWYTPMLFRDMWVYRRYIAQLGLLLYAPVEESPAEAAKKPAVAAQTESKVEIPQEPETPPEPAALPLGETKTGQLTFF